MQYSPNNAHHVRFHGRRRHGRVSARLGKQIVSSADLVSQFEAVLTEEQIASHSVAQKAIDAILAEGWLEMGRRLRPLPAARRRSPSSTWSSGSARPCAAKAWSGRTAPTSASTPTAPTRTTSPPPSSSAPIREGDFVLIDIWGRVDKPGSVFYDITWTGVVGREPTEREQLVFETVRNARDAAIAAVERPSPQRPNPRL